jgi:DNA-binding GntR family transcriptional regulator
VSLRPLDAPRTTLAAHAREAVLAAIADGSLVPGARYSVATLADELGVSRTPVREALLMLEREGRVRFERNRGVRIIETSAHDIAEAFQLRLLLEVPATARAAGRLGTEGLDRLQGELEAMTACAAAADEARFMDHDQRFHDVILRAAGNARLAAVVAGVRDAVRGRGASTVGRSRDLGEILAEHEAILAALRAGKPKRAAKAMRAHLLSTGRLLVAQEGAQLELDWSLPSA